MQTATECPARKIVNTRCCLLSALVVLALAWPASAVTTNIYFNGFETDIAGWDAFGGGFNPTRVPSGTNGITSAAGAFHAESSATGSAGDWGGYNYGAGHAVPTTFQEYITSVDIFLDVDAGWSNDTRFDFSSAINNAAGTHLRDFVFNAGFYDDDTGPGAGSERFVISASNTAGRADSFPQNPGLDPIAILGTGWYTFEHHFYDNAGVLAVDLSIYNTANALLQTWTLSAPADLIVGVGGNRYGWFVNNEFDVLAFDNTSLDLVVLQQDATIPEPLTAGLGLLAVALHCCRRGTRQRVPVPPGRGCGL